MRHLFNQLRHGGGRDRCCSVDRNQEPPAHLLKAPRLALRGWIGFVEAVSLDWLDRKEPERPAVRGLRAATLVSTLAAVLGLDPRSGLPGDLLAR